MDREAAAYQRDVHRARRTVVFLQKAPTDFHVWFGPLQGTPLFADEKTLVPVHLHPPGHTHAQADGIFLRDPESLLFKEWTREDTENSSMGRGFLFTAIAYSDSRHGASFNTTDYYFALDPERAGPLHLYNVWARLQANEIRALLTPEHANVIDEWMKADRPPCMGFEERAEGSNRAFFFDPWFDGNNYRCTIVPTPNAGTLIRPGVAHDLSDDPVATAVREELESAIFISEIQTTQYSASANGMDERNDKLLPASSSSEGIKGAVKASALLGKEDSRSYSFIRVRLEEGVAILDGKMAEQVGQTLWRWLHPEAGLVVPPEFVQRHLLKTANWVGVWSLRGVAVAHKAAAEQTINAAAELFANLVSLAKGLKSLTGVMRKSREESEKKVETGKSSLPIANGEALPNGKGALIEKEGEAQHGDAEYKSALELGERLMEQLGDVQSALVLPDNRLVSEFFNAGRLQNVLLSLRDVYLAAVEQNQTKKLNDNVHEVAELQSKLEWLEVFIVGVYAVELVHLIVSVRC